MASIKLSHRPLMLSFEKILTVDHVDRSDKVLLCNRYNFDVLGYDKCHTKPKNSNFMDLIIVMGLVRKAPWPSIYRT